MTPQEIEEIVDSKGTYRVDENTWISTGNSLHGEQFQYDDTDPHKSINFLQYEYWLTTTDGKAHGADSIEELLDVME